MGLEMGTKKRQKLDKIWTYLKNDIAIYPCLKNVNESNGGAKRL